MTSPHPLLRTISTAAAALVLSLTACAQSEVDNPPEDEGATGSPSGQELLAAALLEGCDSQPFMGAVERFIQAHQRVIERTDPGTEEYGAALDNLDAPRLDQIFVAAASLHMNEMHDCQRLLVPEGNGWRYGPLVAIFADPGLLERPDPAGGVIADVFNFGGGPYADLGLEDGLHCLWVQPGTTGPWSAAILRPAPSVAQASCESVTPGNSLAALNLQTVVRTVRNPPPGREVYPKTARWMWDEASGRQYLGFRCGDAWCEIASDAVTLDPSEFRNADEVPGWFDAQYLGYVVDDTLAVSRLFGTMEPGPAVQHPAAEQAQALMQQPGLASRITLVGDDEPARDAYREKMDFFAPATGNPRTSRERLMMRVDPGNPPVWRAWTESRGVERDLARAVDVNHSGSGTVRWRWVEDDEAGWISCRLGCCTYGRRFF